MTSRSTTSPIQAAVANVLAQRAALPAIRATYRIQLNREFTFNHATDLVPYLADLGVSHLYASPLFAAAPGSMHGYDVVDYSRLNPEIGTREDFDRMVRTLHQHGLGLIVDFVPNHMGIEKGANAWWQDVLQNGRMSRFAEFFDIDWTPLKRELRGKVLLPFLGGHYGEVLEARELQLVYERGDFRVQYWDTPFPLDPQTYPQILRRVQAEIAGLLAPDDLDALELESVIAAFDRLPVADDTEPDAEEVAARFREQLVTSRRLLDVIERNEVISTALERVVSLINGTVGTPASFDELDALLTLQHYRLSYWRVASEEINYRRFFAINTLAAIRQEDPPVFEATHDLLMDLLADGSLDGVRFDHPDGLWDPERYFHDVQANFLRAAVRRMVKPESEQAWQAMVPELDATIAAELQRIGETTREWPVWVVAEKILEHGEDLPTSWKIAGTVGYEFLQAANSVLVNPASRTQFDTIYARFTGEKIRFPELVYDMKLWQVREAFASELNVLANVVNRISESDRHSRDFTFNNLRSALREVIACFGVYRTYTTCRESEVSAHDAATIHAAVDEAIRRNPQIDASVFDFLRRALLLHHTGEAMQRRHAPCHFAMKLQQLSGPVMAKGLEDTAFYRFNRLTSLNEVGGDPSRFGTSEGDFHKQNQARLAQWPLGMINSSTHDTKRSEDVRAAISVLSERPTEWRAALNRWTRLNRKFKVKLDGALAPNRIDTWVLYQTLIGTWPQNGSAGLDAAYTERLQEYMIKVVREAGRFSTWINPNEGYEQALRDFVAGMLNRRRNKAFLADIDAFIGAQRGAAQCNALSQQLLKLTSPGVPDIYQGTELWDDSLVDPDNRRAVDYATRQQLLADSRDRAKLVERRATGGLKLALSSAMLHWRKEHRDLFAHGTYTPVRVSGPASEHVIAFLRELGDQRLLVLAPRLMYTLAADRPFGNTEVWANTLLQLPSGVPKSGWVNVLDGQPIDSDIGKLIDLFTHMPLAVLGHGGTIA